MAFFNVLVYHGLCTSFHSLEHKPQKLTGLRVQLQNRGYRVDLYEVPYVDYCMIKICEHEVFRCNLRYLQFNTHAHRDVVATRAIKAVEEASERLRRARSHLWFRTLISENLFTSGPYAPQDYWPVDEEVKAYASCKDCVACCDIVVRKKAIREQTASKCYDFNFTSDSFTIA